LQELNKLPNNPYLRIFIILNRQEENEYSLYYNKYEVNKIKSYHKISSDEYYQIINQITLDGLYEEKQYQKQDNLGKTFIQLLMGNTLKED